MNRVKELLSILCGVTSSPTRPEGRRPCLTSLYFLASRGGTGSTYLSLGRGLSLSDRP